MDITPISAIRPITTAKPFPSAPDLSRVFEVEYLGQPADDEYTPGNRKSARGLEDEEEEADEEIEVVNEDLPLSLEPFVKVNYFA